MYRDIGFQVWTFPVRRSISCKGSKRKPVIEMLAGKGLECGEIMSGVEGCEFVG
jgi:hypothetical protein